MEQLLLNIHLPRKKSLDNFIVGKNNELIEAIQNFVKSTDQLFIFIWGNEGSGKSHLASAVEDYGIKTIEDIETYDDVEQIKIFNLYNYHKETKQKLFITGANSPNHMGLRDDLASRLSWGLVYQIKNLTDKEKILALEAYAFEKNMKLSHQVINFCMKNLRRDLHTLIASLDALDEWSLKNKRLITIPLLKELLKL